MSLNDLEVENLVPEKLIKCDVDTFLKKIPEYNEEITNKIIEKKNSYQGVHYVGLIEKNNINIGMQAFSNDSPFCGVSGTDNIVLIDSDCYTKPMVIQGSGAGIHVTASGIFSDVITLIREK